MLLSPLGSSAPVLAQAIKPWALFCYINKVMKPLRDAKKFRKLGYIKYNGHLEINNSLLNVVLYDKPSPSKEDAPRGPR
jgi:hypothetical protein